MGWRVARSLEVLLAQLNARFPGRSVTSDGSIGDADHQKRDSDHNPWYGPGIVTARDYTHDPEHGLDIQQIADQLLESRDPRIKYVIANRQIATAGSWQWAPYNGTNPHDKHVHLSVVADPRCDDEQPWALPVLGEVAPDGGAEEPNFTTRGNGVNVRKEPRLGAPVVTTLAGPTRVHVSCQTRGDQVDAAGRSSDAWAHLSAQGGYVSNVYIDHPETWLPDVSDC